MAKNLEQWVDYNNDFNNKRAFRSFNAELSLIKKSVGRKFVSYRGPKYSNSMPLYKEENIIMLKK